MLIDYCSKKYLGCVLTFTSASKELISIFSNIYNKTTMYMLYFIDLA
jgi:hypothetical protein